MTNMYPTRIVAATILALQLAFSLATGASAQGHDITSSVANQQGDGVIVSITQVASEDFPQVTADVTVTGEDGLPVEGLTANRFAVLEEGVEVGTASINVEKDDSQSFGMVLALDISTDPENLAQIQRAVKSFIQNLGPQDKLAVIVFFDEVQVAQAATADKAALNAAIDGLEAQGNYTVLNEAILESATLASQLKGIPQGRKVVIVVTDSKDNVRNISTADAVSKALEVGVPIHTIGFGQKISAQELEEIADLTKGQSFFLASPDEVQDRLMAIEELLRLGYKVTFQSGIQADNAEHDFSISLTHRGQTGQSEGSFRAQRGQATVTLSGIVEGQQIGRGEVINLTPQLTAPGPIVSVEYFLDGESLVKQEEAPYSFDWNSSDVHPGAHVLSVQAVDSAGNEGQEEIKLDVVLPLAVTASALQDEVELGNEVVVQAQVDALASVGVSRVEFLLDGETLGVDDTPPYAFAFDSDAYAAGESIVTVRAIDSLGGEVETDLKVRFLAPPEPEEEPESPSWLTIIISVVVGAVLILALSALIRVIRIRKTRYQQAFRLEISNQGNITSRYELQAQDPSETFEFDFALGGASLQQRLISTAVEIEETELTTLQPPLRAPMAAIPTVSQPLPADSGDGAKPGRLASARGAAGKAAGVSGALARILSSVGTLLPGSAGRSAQQASSKLWRGQSQVARADHLTSQVSRVKPAKAPSPATVGAVPQVQPADVTYATEPAPVSQVQRFPVAHAAHAKPTPQESAQPVVPSWAQTPFVEPGETLSLDLLVNPIKRFRSQNFPFTFLSRSIEHREAPLIAEEIDLYITSPSWLRRLYPYLVVFLVMSITIMIYISFLMYKGILG